MASADAPNIAFVTMVRDDDQFLKLWVNHYAAMVERKHLFILFDGFDQKPAPFTKGCQITLLPQIPISKGWDVKRWEMLTNFANMLLGRFDVVVLNDVDELLVTDPASGISLVEAISAGRHHPSITPFAVEIIHRTDLEPSAVDFGKPILSQRKYVRVNSSYAKPCIITKPICWNMGGHYSNHPDLFLSDCIYLFHLKFVDHQMLLSRQAQRNEIVLDKDTAAADIAGEIWSASKNEITKFLEKFQEFDPIRKDFDFEWQRQKIRRGWTYDDRQNIWRRGVIKATKTYEIPERFEGAF
ncbi:hypothetical protein OE810_11230 [Rhodobacteraceae bacterium XHP0102]|nr:hypothetical protein [Rhodobacteraceae bacterium XHP0102]